MVVRSRDDVVDSVPGRHRIAMKPHVALTNPMRAYGLPRHAISVFLNVWPLCFNCWLHLRDRQQIVERLTSSSTKRFDHQAYQTFHDLQMPLAACGFIWDVRKPTPTSATPLFIRLSICILLRSTLRRILLAEESLVTSRRGRFIEPVPGVRLGFPEADISHHLT